MLTSLSYVYVCKKWELYSSVEVLTVRHGIISSIILYKLIRDADSIESLIDMLKL